MSLVVAILLSVALGAAFLLGRWIARTPSTRPRRSLHLVPPPSHAEGSPAGAGSPRTSVLGALALQDWLVSIYMVLLWLFVAQGEGPRRDPALGWLTVDVVAFFVLLAVARARSTPTRVANVAYRLALPGAIISTFTQLHLILPSIRAATFDADIYALDKRLFGFEPAEAWDRFVTPATTEWFAFFYYLYFGIVLVHVLPMAIFERRMKVLRELSWGIFFVFCVGQLVYVAVPGFGPYRLLESRLAHPLEGPIFWPLVSETVASFDGAHRTDIFPSLHTAVPTFLTLFSFRHRKLSPFRYTWPVMGFVTVNIILATMFLRWHYLLDVIAGITLATTAFVTARFLPAREDEARRSLGDAPIWSPLYGTDPLAEEPAPAAPAYSSTQP